MAIDYYKLGSLYLKLTSPMLERVIGAVMVLSQDITNEAETTEGHAKHLAWATANKTATPEQLTATTETIHRKALVGSVFYLTNFDSLTDAQIKNNLSGFINTVAVV